MRIVTISGSLRATSSNTVLLRALALLAPPDVEVVACEAIGTLPFFNPDFDTPTPPPTVAAFRAELRAADGVIFSTPEYAHGVPGALKNALDWVVSSGDLYRKPVALINASPLAAIAQESLMETLRTMENTIVGGQPFRVPLPRNSLAVEAIVADPELAKALRAVVGALQTALNS